MKLIILVLLLAVCIKVNAQTLEESHHEEFGNNSIMLFTGYTLVPKGKEGERENYLIVPTIGIDYIRDLNEKFFLGLYIDLELSNYFVETGDLDQLTRKNALAIVIVGGKKVNDWFGIYIGGGIEIERSENLGIIKGGVEFFKELDGGWEAKIPLYIDYKFEYTAFGFGLGVSKRF